MTGTRQAPPTRIGHTTRRLPGSALAIELKVPPALLGVITAALMWCAASATPDFDLLFPSRLVFPLGLALVGAVTCLAGVVCFRRAKTTVNPMKPESTSSLVVSGIY